MNKHISLRNLQRVLFLLIMVSLVPSCQNPTETSRVWIDDPLDGEHLPVEPLVIHSTGTTTGTIREMTLIINGKPVRTDNPAPEGAFIPVSQPWEPPEPGTYHIQVEMKTGSGELYYSREISVQIGIFTPTPTLTQTPTLTATLTSTPPPTVTSTTTPTLTPTTIPEIRILFNADRTQIPAGECTILRWRITGAEQAALNGSSVLYENTREVCPQQDTTFQITASNPLGEKAAVLTITVEDKMEPPRTPGNLRIQNRVCSSSEYALTLKWDDPGPREDGFRMYRDGELIADLAADTESFRDNPPGSGPFQYSIEAYNTSGTSEMNTVQEEGCLY